MQRPRPPIVTASVRPEAAAGDSETKTGVYQTAAGESELPETSSLPEPLTTEEPRLDCCRRAMLRTVAAKIASVKFSRTNCDSADSH